MSDELMAYGRTFCVILDRNKIFKIPNYWFSKIGHVTLAYIKMSEITLRIQCKHSRNPAGPASCRNPNMNSRNLGLAIMAPFFRVRRNSKNGRCKIFCCQGRTKFFWAYGSGPRSFVALGAALACIKGHIPDEERGCAGLCQLRIPFST